MSAPSESNGDLTTSSRSGNPDLALIDWDHYQVPLTPETTPRFAVSAARPVRLDLASPGSRFMAVVLDNVGFLLIWVALASTDSTFPFDPGKRILFVWLVAGFLVVFSISQIILLSLRGQTLGKMALGIRIVRYRDGENPGFVRAVAIRNLVTFLISCIPLIGQVFLLIDILTIFGNEHRCLHDLMADTKVVEAQ
jgi:uncharacterized RDD family membrane protein YckC